MSNEFNPQPIPTPDMQSQPSFSDAQQTVYESRRQRREAEGMVVQGDHEVAMMFGLNGSHEAERFDFRDVVNMDGLDEESIRILQQAQERYDTWQSEPGQRVEFAKTVESVAFRRNQVARFDSQRMALISEIVPRAQQERDQAEIERNEQRGVMDEAISVLRKQEQVVGSFTMSDSLIQGNIDDALEVQKERKQIRRQFRKRYLELVLGRTEDGSEVEPLSDVERMDWIIDGVQYGPLATTEPVDNYIPGSQQELERAKAVVAHIIELYDAEIAQKAAYIQGQEKLRREALARKATAELERDEKGKTLRDESLEYSNKERLALEAVDRYKEAGKLPGQIIGQPAESFGDQVEREWNEKKQKAAIDHARQQHMVAFGTAGARSEADRLAGRAPLAIEGARVAIQGARDMAARIKIPGIGRTTEISIGYPKELEQ